MSENMIVVNVSRSYSPEMDDWGILGAAQAAWALSRAKAETASWLAPTVGGVIVGGKVWAINLVASREDATYLDSRGAERARQILVTGRPANPSDFDYLEPIPTKLQRGVAVIPVAYNAPAEELAAETDTVVIEPSSLANLTAQAAVLAVHAQAIEDNEWKIVVRDDGTMLAVKLHEPNATVYRLNVLSRELWRVNDDTKELEMITDRVTFTSDIWADPTVFDADSADGIDPEGDPDVDVGGLSLRQRADMAEGALRTLGASSVNDVARHLETLPQNAYRWLAELERQGTATRTRDGHRDVWELAD